MPTAEAEILRLTEAHRLSQARLGAQTVSEMLDVWPLLDPSDIDGTFPRWLRAVNPLVDARRSSSARLASNYTEVIRALQLGPSVAPGPIVLAGAVPVDQLTTSLIVTGPAKIRAALSRGVLFDSAVEQAKSDSARAAMRHVLNGGRDTVLATVNADRRALGWARATSGRPCAFCAMLASRGAVYRTEGTGGFKAHDGCSCTVQPLYSRDAPLPAGASDYLELFQSSTSGLSGDEAVAAFRKAFAQRGN